MSQKLKANLKAQIRITLETFAGIDIFQRGFYQLKIRLYRKHRSVSGTSRTDGRVLKTTTLDEEAVRATEMASGERPRSSTVSKCTVGHVLCDWRCKINAAAPDSLSPDETVAYTQPFFVYEQEQRVNLSVCILFELPVVRKLYKSSTVQDHCAYIDMELFFDANEKPNLHSPSKQRRIVKINHIDTQPILPALPHRILFDSIYYARLDMCVSSVLVETKLQSSGLRKSPSRLAIVKGSRLSFRSIGSSLANVALESTRSLESLGGSRDSVGEPDSDQQAPTVHTFEDILFMQLRSLLLVFAQLGQLTSTDARPLLSRHRLFADTWSGMAGLFCKMPRRFVSGQMSFADLISGPDDAQEILAELQSFVIAENVDEEALATALEAISSTMTHAVADLWDAVFVAPHSTHSTVADARRQLLEYQSHSVDLKEFMSSPFDHNAKPRFDCHHPSTLHEYPLPDQDVWLVEITDDGSPRPGRQAVDSPCDPHHDCASNIHLVVFVHGLMGNCNDLRSYRNQLRQHLADLGEPAGICYLFSKCNQSNTFNHLVAMGNNLAKEILDFIQNEGLSVGKISFVCHSLGGIIARLAIRHECLVPFRCCFHAFTSFASPHLSLALHTNHVIGSALGIYQSLYSADSIRQLYLEDHDDKRLCLLYQLSQDKTMAHFDSVCLFGSEQDQYVHFEGALACPLVHWKQYSAFAPALKPVFSEMQRNFVSSCRSISRFQICFGRVEESKANGWLLSGDPLGREAHIALLTNRLALDLAISKTGHLLAV
ncbi:hypothetical protein HDU91_006417 [Kappamyces sp. JEL0680]|nr:hypothetical protein HDU91_006417 [Kappamyces sp. JEL0680]